MSAIYIPLEIIDLDDNGFHPLVEVVVLGITFQVVLDTGASKTAFDQYALQQIEGIALLEETDYLSTGLGTTTMPSFTVVLADFRIGDLHIPDFKVAVLDLSMINLAYEKLNKAPVLGVLGGDILMQYHANIDYRNKLLTLFSGQKDLGYLK